MEFRSEEEKAVKRLQASVQEECAIEKPPKRRRRKPIKSCAFCRQRKLRCDQKRPICTTCYKKGRKECIYTDSLTSPTIESLSSNGSGPKFKEDQADSLKVSYNQNATGPTKNLLRDLYFFQTKENGRRIMFGPTAVRVFCLNERWGLNKRLSQLWKMIKMERTKIKNRMGFSMLEENSLIEASYDVPSGAEKNYSLVDEVRDSLPPYETILRRLDHFFDDSELFPINQAFDRVKVMKDFRESFIHDTTFSGSSGRPIKALVASSKINYYKIGVILAILMYTSLDSYIPIPIHRFFVMINGLSTGKTNYIERAQVTFLRYCFRAKWGHTGGDATHTTMLVHSMVNEAMMFGLHTNIDISFAGYEAMYGTLESLKKLWLWIMLIDLNTALLMGYSLKISEDHIFDESLYDIDKDVPNSLYHLIGQFLKIARPMILVIHNKNFTPDLKRYSEEIVIFIEEDFPSINTYTGEAMVQDTNSHEIVLGSALSLLLAFYGLRYLTLDERTPLLKNSLATTTMIAFSLSVNLCKKSYLRDRKKFPETLHDSFKNLSPHLSLTVSIMQSLLKRALSILYIILYHKLTLFESGMLVFKCDNVEKPIDMSTLRVSSTERLSLLSAFHSFSKIFDSLVNNEDKTFNSVIRRSQILLHIFGLERLCHRILEKVLESRKLAEEAWILDSQGGFESISSEGIDPPSGRSFEDSVSNIVSEQGLNSGNSTETPACDNATNMTDAIEDYFWANYNDNWEEFLGNVENVDLYYDLMM